MSRILLRFVEIALDPALDAPRDRQQPVEIIAHDGGLGRHRAHLAELLELGHGLLAGFLRQLGLLDLVLELGQVVAAFLAVAELLLDRLHLLVQIVLALSLLHLTLDAAPDLALDLEDRDLALHQREDTLQPLGDRSDLEDLLLLGDLDGEMRGDGVGELRIVFDLARGAEHFGRDLLVELHVAFELGHDRAGKRLDLVLGADRLLDGRGLGLEIIFVIGKAGDGGAARALDQHLHGAVRQFQQLQHRGERAEFIDAVGSRLVIRRVLLGDEENLLVGAHHLFERGDRFLAADEERYDHVGENDDVPERQHRIKFRAGFCCLGRVRVCHDNSVAFF